VKHPVGTVLAALLLVGSLVAYVASGDVAASSKPGTGSGAGSGSGSGAGSGGSERPPTSVYQALPACRLDVTTNGIGSQRHHHVTVVLDNDLSFLWLKITSPLGTRVVQTPARNGWAQVALASDEEPSAVVVYGSSNLEPFTAGCAWSA
jgi:hypothetical protein